MSASRLLRRWLLLAGWGMLLAGLLPQLAQAQDAKALKLGSEFGQSLAPLSARTLVNPAAVSSQAWGSASGSGTATPTAVPSGLGGFSKPMAGSDVYASAKAAGLGALGVQAQIDCAIFSPGPSSDPLQVQACELTAAGLTSVLADCGARL